MRPWLIRLVTAVLRWLDPPVVGRADPVAARTHALVAWAETLAPGTSGEYKRHQVLAALQKQFPGARTRDLAFVIECVLQETK